MKNQKSAKFVLHEVKRIHKNLAGYASDEEKKGDLLFHIPLSRGIAICGRKGMSRLQEIMAREFKARLYSRTCDFEAFSRVFIREFGIAFVEGKTPPTEENIASAIQRSYENVRSGFQSVTHYSPCVLFAEPDPTEFSIGPVTFTHISLFRERHQAQIEEALAPSEALTPEQYEKADNFILNSAKLKNASVEARQRYYRMSKRRTDKILTTMFTDNYLSYNWVASLEISAAEMKLSRKQADYITEQALNVIRLLFGEKNSTKIRRAIVANSPSETFRIHRPKDKPFNFSFSRAMQEHGFKNWNEVLETGKLERELLGGILFKLAQLEQLTHLEERFLDTLTWYGEGITEPAPAFKIVKFVTAIERLTVTEKTDRLTDMITRRSAGLVKSIWEEDKLKEIQDFYDLRSALVHGSRSPWDDDLQAEMAGLSSLCRKIIMAGLRLYQAIGISNPANKQAELSSAYEKLYPSPKKVGKL